VKTQVVIPLGGGVVCFILAWVSFSHYQDSQTGGLFVGLGLLVFVLGLVLGRGKG